MQGWSNGELLEESVEKSYRLGEYFKKEGIAFDDFISSDSMRTVETMNNIKAAMGNTEKTRKLESIREMYFGQAEAEDTKIVWKKVAATNGFESSRELLESMTAINRCNLLHLTPNYNMAENKVMFLERVKEGLEYIVNSGKKNVLVVTHGLTILAALEISGYTKSFFSSFDNLSCTKLQYKDGLLEAVYINESFI